MKYSCSGAYVLTEKNDFDGGKERNLRKSIIRNGALASIFSIISALAAGQFKFF